MFEGYIKLIKYLHQEMGLDLLVFESGIYDCQRAWEQIQAGESVPTAFGNSIFSLWAEVGPARLGPEVFDPPPEVSFSEVDICRKKVESSIQKVEVSMSEVETCRKKMEIFIQKVEVSMPEVETCRKKVELFIQKVETSMFVLETCRKKMDLFIQKVETSMSVLETCRKKMECFIQKVETSMFVLETCRKKMESFIQKVEVSMPKVEHFTSDIEESTLQLENPTLARKRDGAGRRRPSCRGEQFSRGPRFPPSVPPLAVPFPGTDGCEALAAGRQARWRAPAPPASGAETFAPEPSLHRNME